MLEITVLNMNRSISAIGIPVSSGRQVFSKTEIDLASMAVI